jgi:hypothetical protein
MRAQTTQAEEDQRIGDLVKLALGLVLMALVMLWWWNHPFPSGKQPDLLGFVQFFGRELLLIIPLIAVAAILALVAAWRICAGWLKQRGRSRDG